MNKTSKKSLPAWLYSKVMGDSDRLLYLKIHAKVPPVPLLAAFTIGTMAAEESTSIARTGRTDSVRVAQIESSGRMVNTAFWVLGAGVFSAYLLAAADRLAIAQSDRLNTRSSNQDDSEES